MENPTSLFVGPVRVLYADAEEEGKQAAEKELSGDDLLLFKVSSEYQARQILEKERMDILICDNSLPSEGGASLLKWVRERHRGIGRIIVGRERDRSSLMQALTKGVAVLSLSNPWEPGTLKERILHFGRLKRTLNNPRLFRLINTLDRLPTLPRIYNDFMDALERDKAAADLAKILNRDPAIASKILQIANSAFFRSTKSLSLERAVVYLGSNTLREIVLSVSFAENSQITPEQDRWIDELSFHALQVNTFTHSFYQHLYGTPLPDAFSSVGLLHDIGKNLLFSLFPRRFKSLWEKSHKEGLPFRSAETEEEVFHDEIGAYFLDLWNLPLPAVESALYHHFPQECSIPLRNALMVTSGVNKISETILLKGVVGPEILFEAFGRECGPEGEELLQAMVQETAARAEQQ
ncbi:MAG TPA: HDOD domain-containing protein [Candidatus Aminicenantes bacterium]|nr:HDOD domain-containing protein [Candidatus Aminicenantes bacterium]HPT00666.1 HDOD domain-containing protein [Candidatus Aminicenantes bacterium]